MYSACNEVILCARGDDKDGGKGKRMGKQKKKITITREGCLKTHLAIIRTEDNPASDGRV